MPSRAVRRLSGSTADRLDSRRRLLDKIAMNRRKTDGENPRLRAMERTRSRGSRSHTLVLAAAAACSSSRLSIPAASRVIGRPHLSSQSGSIPHEREHHLSHHRPRFAQSSIGSASVRPDMYPPAPVTFRSSSKRDEANRPENPHDGFEIGTNGSDCHDLPRRPF
jgi:hypothetical protein